MRGFFYAPIIGIFLLGIAFIVAGYVFNAEKSLVKVISSQNERIVTVGYVDIAPLDIRSSFAARLRGYVLEDLGRKKVEDALDNIINNFPSWFSSFLRDFVREYSGDLRISAQGSFRGDVQELDNLLLLLISGPPLSVEVNTPQGITTVLVDINGIIPVPFPLDRIHEAGNITVSKPSIDVINFQNRSSFWTSIRNFMRKHISVNGCEVDVSFSYKDGNACLLEGNKIDLVEWPRVITSTVNLTCQWDVPGLGVTKTIHLHRDLDPFTLFEENLLIFDGYGYEVDECYSDLNALAEEVLKGCGCQKQKYCGGHECEHPIWHCHRERCKHLCEHLCDLTGCECE